MTLNCLLCISRKIRFAELEELGNVDHVAVDGDHLRQGHVLEAATKKIQINFRRRAAANMGITKQHCSLFVLAASTLSLFTGLSFDGKSVNDR